MRPVLEALVIAASMLSLFVLMSQALASLLGRRVPVAVLDEAVVRPDHRRGPLRPIGVAWSAAIVVLTQGVAIAALVQGGEASVRIIYALELILAATWGAVVIAAGRRRRAGPDH